MLVFLPCSLYQRVLEDDGLAPFFFESFECRGNNWRSIATYKCLQLERTPLAPSDPPA